MIRDYKLLYGECNLLYSMLNKSQHAMGAPGRGRCAFCARFMKALWWCMRYLYACAACVHAIWDMVMEWKAVLAWCWPRTTSTLLALLIAVGPRVLCVSDVGGSRVRLDSKKKILQKNIIHPTTEYISRCELQKKVFSIYNVFSSKLKHSNVVGSSRPVMSVESNQWKNQASGLLM